MNITDVLKLTTGKVVCIDNAATITIAKKGDQTTFQPSFPENMPALSAENFKDMYREKKFTQPDATTGTSKED